MRGIEFAKTGRSRGKVTAPAVVGAVIDLGFCLDLISSTGVAAVKAADEDFICLRRQDLRGSGLLRKDPHSNLRSRKVVHQGRLPRVGRLFDGVDFSRAGAFFSFGDLGSMFTALSSAASKRAFAFFLAGFFIRVFPGALWPKLTMHPHQL